MNEVYVSIWLDTEDYMNPRSDDAALRLARILSDLGAPATFKMVGEKLRSLERGGRVDVIDAIRKHDVGYHTDWHSRHPMVSEYLVDAGWDDGVELVLRNEGPGLDDVRRVFEGASSYGQAGAAWAPQPYAACREWGIPVYLDESDHMSVEHGPHHYCGVIGVFGLGPANARVRLGGTDGLTKSKAALDRAVDFARSSGGGIVNVYYHPCEFISPEFPDSINFGGGCNPAPGRYEIPKPFAPSDVEQGYAQFEDYVKYMLVRDDIKLVTGSEIAESYRDRLEGASLDTIQINRAAEDFIDARGFVGIDSAWLSPAQTFQLVVDRLVQIADSQVESAIEIMHVLGPKDLPSGGAITEAWVAGNDLLTAALSASRGLHASGQVPATPRIGDVSVTPEAFLTGACRLLLAVDSGAAIPGHVGLAHERLATEVHVAEDSEELWRWPIHSPGFRAPRIMEQARLQAWTIKPAVRA